jgi:hypothetical protein
VYRFEYVVCLGVSMLYVEVGVGISWCAASSRIAFKFFNFLIEVFFLTFIYIHDVGFFLHS